MKFLTLILLCQIAFASLVSAQTSSFSVLDKRLAGQPGGWNGNKAELAKIFQEERKKLGDKFENELRRYLSDDVEKYFWIALFLDGESYLHESAPLPDLALEIRENALKMMRQKTDEKSLGNRLRLAVTAAVAAEKADKRELAANYKKEADSLAVSGVDLGVYFPALGKTDRCNYQNIGKNPTPCLEESSDKTVAAGVVNGKAIILTKPDYPKEIRKKKISGEVQVKVLIDEQGKVTSAQAVSGPDELRQSAVDAALSSRFTPTLLSGNYVKVTGVIVFRFQ